jgi:hypothetical protein
MNDIETMDRKQIKLYVSDLEQNLNINKELLQNVLMSSDLNDSSKDIITKLQDENARLSKGNKVFQVKNSEYFETMKKLQKDRDDMDAHMKDKDK